MMKKLLFTALAVTCLGAMPIQAKTAEFVTFKGPNFSLVYPGNWKKEVDKTGVVTLEDGKNGFVSFNPTAIKANAEMKQMLQGLKSELGTSAQNNELLGLLENALNQPNDNFGMSDEELKELMGDEENAKAANELKDSLMPMMTEMVVDGFMQDAKKAGLLTQADLANKPTYHSGTEKLGGLEVSKSWTTVKRPKFYIEAETLYTTKKGFPFIFTAVAMGQSEKELKQVEADIETIKMNWEWKK